MNSAMDDALVVTTQLLHDAWLYYYACYTHTAECMLTNYVMCIPLLNKSADVVVNASLTETYCRFGGS